MRLDIKRDHKPFHYHSVAWALDEVTIVFQDAYSFHIWIPFHDSLGGGLATGKKNPTFPYKPVLKLFYNVNFPLQTWAGKQDTQTLDLNGETAYVSVKHW